MVFAPLSPRESNSPLSPLHHTRSFPVFDQTWIAPNPYKRHRRGSVDRPLTPARVRHASGARKLSLYDNTEPLSSEEEDHGCKPNADWRKRFFSAESKLEKQKLYSTGDSDDSTQMWNGLSSMLLRPEAKQTVLPKSKSLDLDFSEIGKTQADKSSPGKRSLDSSKEKWPTQYNITSSTTSSGLTRRPKKESAKETETKRRHRKSLPIVFKIKRNSLPNLGLFKNVFSRSFGNSDITEPSKEIEKPPRNQRRGSLPEHKLRETNFPKFGLKKRKTSASSNSSNSTQSGPGIKSKPRKASKDGTK